MQEAAYSLIPKELRAEAHLRIGMLLAAHTPEAKRDEAIFEIVNQLNRGSHLIASVEERERVADLNLIAGKRAKSRDCIRRRTQVPQSRQRPPDGGDLGASLRTRVLDRAPDGRVRAADR